MIETSDQTIGVIVLGYVGLPLAVEFGKQRRVIGFDVSASRMAALQAGRDVTLEVAPDDLSAANYLTYSNRPEELKSCGISIVAVPTPIDHASRPDLSLLVKASETAGRAMSKGAIVIYESTVYPGCTREVCVPISERGSGLTFNKDFFVGYSPERINPGDKGWARR